MKKENKNKKYLILIFISLIIILLIGISVTNSNTNTPSNSKEDYVDNEFIKKGLHITKRGRYTGYCSLGMTHYLDIDVLFPEIALNKPNAKNLNNIILKDFQNVIDFVSKDNIDQQDHKKKTTLYITSLYNYLIQDDIIYLLVDVNYSFYNAPVKRNFKNYFYNMKDDKILTFEEGATHAGFKLNNFQKINPNDFDITSWTDCENGICGFKIIDQKLVPFVISTSQ